jgi:hypothetical protein
MIRFACPVCNKVYKAPGILAGKKTICKKCKSIVLVPAGPASVPLQGIPLPSDPPRVVNYTPSSLPPDSQEAAAYEQDDSETEVVQSDGEEPDYRQLRRRQRRVRKLKSLGVASGVGLGLVVLLSCLVGWPFAGIQRQLPQALRKPNTLEELVERLKDKRVVVHAKYLPPGHETEGHPGYALFPEAREPSIPCVLIEFESERDVELFVRFIGAAANREAGGMADAREQEAHMKRFQNNELPGIFQYGRFLFTTGNHAFAAKIRKALP